jgi:hypothetical protein
MSQLTIVNRSQLLAAATAISAVGLFLTVSPPAQAHPMLPFPLAPACSQWAFNGDFSLKQSNGALVHFYATGPDLHGVSAEAKITGGGRLQGPATGGIQGDKLDFKVTWSENSVGDYTGTVGNGGFAHGDTADEYQPFGDGPGSYAHWDSTGPLVCSTPAAPPPATAPPLIGGLPADTVMTPFPDTRSVPPLAGGQ